MTRQARKQTTTVGLDIVIVILEKEISTIVALISISLVSFSVYSYIIVS